MEVTLINGTAPPKLLDRLRAKIQLWHYSIHTETQYVHWVRRFILFHGERSPMEMGGPESQAFLSHLVQEGNVAAATHNQVLSALLFLYRAVPTQNLSWMEGMVCAMKCVVQAFGINKLATPHTLRHSFASHLLQRGQRQSRSTQYLPAPTPRRANVPKCSSLLEFVKVILDSIAAQSQRACQFRLRNAGIGTDQRQQAR